MIVVDFVPFANSKVYYEGGKAWLSAPSDIANLSESIFFLCYTENDFNVTFAGPESFVNEVKNRIKDLEIKEYSNNKINVERMEK